MIVTMDMATGQRLDEEENVLARDLAVDVRVPQALARLALREHSEEVPALNPAIWAAAPCVLRAAEPVGPPLH